MKERAEAFKVQGKWHVMGTMVIAWSVGNTSPMHCSAGLPILPLLSLITQLHSLHRSSLGTGCWSYTLLGILRVLVCPPDNITAVKGLGVHRNDFYIDCWLFLPLITCNPLAAIATGCKVWPVLILQCYADRQCIIVYVPCIWTYCCRQCWVEERQYSSCRRPVQQSNWIGSY